MTLRDRWVSLMHALPPFRGRLAIARIVGERLFPADPLALATLPNGFRVRIDLRWKDYDSLYYFRTYEERLTRVIRDALDVDSGSFIDVGANVGIFPIAVADVLLRRGGRALAVEPLPSNFAFLRESIDTNGLGKVIDAQPIAVGDADGTLELWQFATGAIANAAPVTWRSAAEPQPSAGERVAVPMRRLDDVVRERGITNVRFVKIDVEGAELFVLRGARELLLRDRPTLYCELHRQFMAANGITIDDVRQFAEAVDYEIRPLGPENPQAFDALLVPRSAAHAHQSSGSHATTT